jgi:hypothetical protein
MGTKLFDFESSGGITTVLASGIAGNAVGSFVGIGATFCAFHGDGNAYAFLTCHGSIRGSGTKTAKVYTQIPIFAYSPLARQQFV